ncbi:MAG: GNAT family N-acetyltransferase [Chloroflexota bacterium]
MVNIDTFDGLRPWIEERIGCSLAEAVKGSTVILPNRVQDSEPLLALRIGESAFMRVRPTWFEAARDVADGLTLDELFSIFGAYELARVALAEDVGVWGPSWYYFGDAAHFSATPAHDVVHLSSEEIDLLADREIFWHCNWWDAVVSFGILDDGQLVALATVHDQGSPVYEFGVDVAPGSGRQGLGRSVVSAAGKWILQQGGLILARTAPWNVPSSRLQRSMGLRYIMCDIVGIPGPFRVPPQPLGKPLPDAELYNYYPDWAMNRGIGSRSG